jgi:hypothetical protein
MSKLHRELKTTETNYNTLYLFCIQGCFEQWNEEKKKKILTVLKILHGRIIINLKHKEKLKDYKNVIRSLASHRISLTRKKRTLLTFYILIPILYRSVGLL